MSVIRPSVQRVRLRRGDAETACHSAKEASSICPSQSLSGHRRHRRQAGIRQRRHRRRLGAPIAVWIVRTWPLFPVAALSNGDVCCTTIDHHSLVGHHRAVWHGGLSIRHPTIEAGSAASSDSFIASLTSHLASASVPVDPPDSLQPETRLHTRYNDEKYVSL